MVIQIDLSAILDDPDGRDTWSGRWLPASNRASSRSARGQRPTSSSSSGGSRARGPMGSRSRIRSPIVVPKALAARLLSILVDDVERNVMPDLRRGSDRSPSAVLNRRSQQVSEEAVTSEHVEPGLGVPAATPVPILGCSPRRVGTRDLRVYGAVSNGRRLQRCFLWSAVHPPTWL